MTQLRSVRIEWSDRTMAYSAICPDCKECVFEVTTEAIINGPRRESGSSLLLPVHMHARHACAEPIG